MEGTVQWSRQLQVRWAYYCHCYTPLFARPYSHTHSKQALSTLCLQLVETNSCMPVSNFSASTTLGLTLSFKSAAVDVNVLVILRRSVFVLSASTNIAIDIIT